MTVYYIDSVNGLDINDGSSVVGPWKTMANLYSRITARAVYQGDKVFFKRGGVYYGRLSARVAVNGAFGALFPGSPVQSPKLIIGAYGDGNAPRPILTGYKEANVAASWTQYAPNVWKIDLSQAAAAVTGESTFDNTNVGHLNINGVTKWFRTVDRPSVATDASGNWAFWSEAQAPGTAASDTNLYVQATANPTTLASSIEICVDGVGIYGSSNMSISGIEVRGYGMNGYNTTGADKVDIIDCMFNKIGGSVLTISNGTRAGNGVQVYGSGSDHTINYNEFQDCYDVAYSCQGPTMTGWANIEFAYNKVWNSNQAIEFWSTVNGGAPTGFVNVKVHHNEFYNSGFSGSNQTRFEAQSSAQLYYDMNTPTDIEIYDNLFVFAAASYLFSRRSSNTVFTPPPGVNSHDNTIVMAPGTLMSYQRTETIETAAAWAAALGWEQNSHFLVLPQNVLTATASQQIELLQAFLMAQAGVVTRMALSNGSGVRKAMATAQKALRISEAIGANGMNQGPLYSGGWYFPETSAVTNMAGAGNTGSMRLLPFTAPAAGRIIKLSYWVNVAGDAGSVVEPVIYRREGKYFLLHFDAGQQDAATVGLHTITIAGFNVYEGQELFVGMNVLAPSGVTNLPSMRAATGRTSSRVPVADSTANLNFAFGNLFNGISLTLGTAAPPSFMQAVGVTTQVPIVGMLAA
ncbi:right-handed parallel beta-helix repeat-containing protein [Subtercola vilae]|nr:right-handed parallel beta-helix repeat-containing protein [Subtercola vilae]